MRFHTLLTTCEVVVAEAAELRRTAFSTLHKNRHCVCLQAWVRFHVLVTRCVMVAAEAAELRKLQSK